MRFLMSIGMAVMLGTAAGPSLAAETSSPHHNHSTQTKTADVASIEALMTRFAAAVKVKDIDTMMSVYSRDQLFVFDIVPPRQLDSWETYKNNWRAFLGSLPSTIDYSISDIVVTVVGDFAYGHNIQTLRWNSADGPTSVVARVSDVYRKRNGEWQIVEEHLSVPVDLRTGKPDLLSKP